MASSLQTVNTDVTVSKSGASHNCQRYCCSGTSPRRTAQYDQEPCELANIKSETQYRIREQAVKERKHKESVEKLKKTKKRQREIEAVGSSKGLEDRKGVIREMWLNNNIYNSDIYIHSKMYF